MKKFIIPQYKFLEMAAIYSTKNIVENNRAVATAYYMNREFVVTGGCFDEKKLREQDYIEAYQVIDLAFYRQPIQRLQPLPYGEHFKEVNAGLRERGYAGMTIFYKNRTLVLVEAVRFEPQLIDQLELKL